MESVKKVKFDEDGFDVEFIKALDKVKMKLWHYLNQSIFKGKKDFKVIIKTDLRTIIETDKWVFSVKPDDNFIKKLKEANPWGVDIIVNKYTMTVLAMLKHDFQEYNMI